MENAINVGIVPVLIGVLEVFKKLGVEVKYIPVISVILGLLLGIAINGISIDSVLIGLAYGLSACGLYSGAKATIEEN